MDNPGQESGGSIENSATTDTTGTNSTNNASLVEDHVDLGGIRDQPRRGRRKDDLAVDKIFLRKLREKRLGMHTLRICKSCPRSLSSSVP